MNLQRVRDLIDKLQHLDPNAIVLVENERDCNHHSPLGEIDAYTTIVNDEEVKAVCIWSRDSGGDWKEELAMDDDEDLTEELASDIPELSEDAKLAVARTQITTLKRWHVNGYQLIVPDKGIPLTEPNLGIRGRKPLMLKQRTEK